MTERRTDFLSMPEGGAGGGVTGDYELVARYEHSGNIVVQPDGLDIDSGIWTVNGGHGLKTGDYVCPVLNFWQDNKLPSNYGAKIPTGIFNQTTYGLAVSVIDETTFMLTTNNTNLKYSNATEIDCSLFHFEAINQNNRGLYAVTGLSEYKTVKIRLYGQYYSSAGLIAYVTNDQKSRNIFDVGLRRANTTSSSLINEMTTQKLLSNYSDVGGYFVGEGSFFGLLELTATKFDGFVDVVFTGDAESFSDGVNSMYFNSMFRQRKSIIFGDSMPDKFGVKLYGSKTALANGCLVEVYAK